MIDQKRLKLAAQMADSQIKRNESENNLIMIGFIILGLSGFYTLGSAYFRMLSAGLMVTVLCSVGMLLLDASVKTFLQSILVFGICMFAMCGFTAWLL